MHRSFLFLMMILPAFFLGACATADQLRETTRSPAPNPTETSTERAPTVGSPSSVRPPTVAATTRTPATSRPSPTDTGPESATWRLMTSTVRSGQDIAISPSDPNIVYVVGDAIYKSTDGGKSWKVARDNVRARDVELSYGGKVVVVSSGTDCGRGGPSPVYRSTDWGATWEQIRQTMLGSLTVDPRNPARFYAATCGGFARSDDAGLTWNALPNPLPGFDGSAIAVSPDSKVIVGAVVSEGGTVKLVRSVDSGASFSPLPAPNLWGAVSVALGEAGRIAVVSSGNAISSADGGKTWTIVNRGLESLKKGGTFPYFEIGRMRPNPRATSILYLATQSGLYRYGPETGKWLSFGQGLSERVVAFDVAVGARSTIFYAATTEGVYRLDANN
jgi:hypothetical protein